MPVDIAAPQIDAEIARSARAVQTFNNLSPELSIFATILVGREPDTGQNVTVTAGPQTCTDGSTIYIRPDGRLGASEISAEDWSDIKASLFHEVAHIAFDSFAQTNDVERAAAIQQITEQMPDSIRRTILLNRISKVGHNYKALSAAWHPYMPMLVNALEDARVEWRLFAQKPGTQKHLARQRLAIFDGPREQIAARIGTPWNERSNDEQAIIGCYLLGAGYAPEKRLSDPVASALREIEDLLVTCSKADTVSDVYAASFNALSELQKRGFLRNGDESDEDIGPTEHQTPPPGSAMQRAEDCGCPHPLDKIIECADEACRGNCTKCGAHLVTTPGEGDGDEKAEESKPTPGEIADGVRQAGGHEHDHHDHSHEQTGPNALDAGKVDLAMNLMREGYDPFTEQPARGVVRCLVAPQKTTDLTLLYNRSAVDKAINTVMPELRRALDLNGMTGWVGNMRAGRVDTRALYRTATGNDRVFGRFDSPETRNYVFVMALDCSSSMGGSMSAKMIVQKNTAYAAGEMLSRLDIPFTMFGYSGTGIYGGRRGLSYDDDRNWQLSIFPVRAIGQPWDRPAKRALFSLESQAANLDGSSMQYARVQGRRMVRRPQTEIVVLYFNDGGMPAENTRNEEQLIAWEVANQRRNGVHYVGVGVQSDAVERAGLELVPCNDPTEGTRNITAKIANILGVRR